MVSTTTATKCRMVHVRAWILGVDHFVKTIRSFTLGAGDMVHVLLTDRTFPIGREAQASE